MSRERIHPQAGGRGFHEEANQVPWLSMGEILGRRDAEYFFDRRGRLGFRLAEVEASGRGLVREEGEGIPSKEKFLLKKKRRRQYR